MQRIIYIYIYNLLLHCICTVLDPTHTAPVCC